MITFVYNKRGRVGLEKLVIQVRNGSYRAYALSNTVFIIAIVYAPFVVLKFWNNFTL